MLDTISPVIKASVIINKDLDLTIHIGQTKIDQLGIDPTAVGKTEFLGTHPDETQKRKMQKTASRLRPGDKGHRKSKQLYPAAKGTGISVKAGSSFVTPAVASVSFSLQTLFFFIPAAHTQKQHFPSHCVLGAPRTRFGADKPPSIHALVTYSSFVLVRPFSSSCGGVISDIGLSFHPFLRDSGYKRFISPAPASSNFRFIHSKKADG
ncbi:hypothetical protein TNCV_4258131 [Trichonephila clavipes]|nr:hypothetical protein TNCV_4258131 [Trichonephila clavipes]